MHPRKKWLEYNEVDVGKSFYIPNCVWEERVEKISQISKAKVKKKLFGGDGQFIAICTGEEFTPASNAIFGLPRSIKNLLANVFATF